MIQGKSIAVILPAYNAAKTLERTVSEIPRDIVDYILLVDDASQDDTTEVAKRLGLEVLRHERNRGYGGNQKTCYARAYAWGADIVVMVHPDYQYTPKLIRAMAALIADDVYDVVLGSRILGKGALQGGMPIYKYVANRILTLLENWLIGQKLSEYHTGYRAFSRKVFEMVRFEANSDDFIFDNEMLVQCHATGLRIAEVTCPTRYFAEASSINFVRSSKYGLQCLAVGAGFLLHRLGLWRQRRFLAKADRRVEPVTGVVPS
jgi:glycosyltransferase involved in cell wall biosynthesis